MTDWPLFQMYILTVASVVAVGWIWGKLGKAE